jgi:hypothetical protein
VFGGLDADGKFATFSGSAMAATLLGNVSSAGGSQRFLQVTPVSDNATSTVSIGVADSLAGTLTYSTPAQRNEDGNVMLDDRGRYFVFREQHAAGGTWTYANGVDGVVSNPDAP